MAFTGKLAGVEGRRVFFGARDEDTRITAAPRAGLATLTQPPRPWTFDDLIKPASRRATEH